MSEIVIYVLAAIGVLALVFAALVAIALVRSGNTPGGDT